MDIVPINKQADGDHSYIAGFANQQIGVFAPDLWLAKQTAIRHFKPAKSKAHLVWVELAEDSNPINLR